VSSVHLAKRVVKDMVERGNGRILFTSSIAALMPGAFEAVYSASKAFLHSFSEALRNELKDTGVTVTALMPGPTNTNFFHRADMDDTKVGASKKDNPAEVAKQGFDALMAGKDDLIAGSLKTKLQGTVTKVLPETVKAEQHRHLSEPGSGQQVILSAQALGSSASTPARNRGIMLIFVAPVDLRGRTGCLNCRERLQNLVCVGRSLRYNPRVSWLKQNHLTLNVQFSAAFDHIADSLIFALGWLFRFIRLLIFPKPHRESLARCKILLAHFPLRRISGVYFLNTCITHIGFLVFQILVQSFCTIFKL
jgi:hypothetical protein